jgi:hypothetical protein
MSSREIPKEGTCSLCGGRYDDYGHNPAPLGKVQERCCTLCNVTHVLPLRLRRHLNSRNRADEPAARAVNRQRPTQENANG